MSGVFVNEIIKSTEKECNNLIASFENNTQITEDNIKDFPQHCNRIGRFIQQSIQYNNMLKQKPEKLKIVTLLFKFLSSPFGMIYCKQNSQMVLTSRNKLQEMLCMSDDYLEEQKELLSYQKIFDPNFYYINSYTREAFNCFLYLYYTKTNNNSIETSIHFY
jgi:hypothetical protein